MRHYLKNTRLVGQGLAHLAHSGVHRRAARKVDAVVHEVLDAVVLDGLQRQAQR